MKTPRGARIRRTRIAPELRGGVPLWSMTDGPWRVLFIGRGAPPQAEIALRRDLVPAGTELAWPRQVHSTRVARARPGLCGEADALVLRAPGIAATIATADCVPVLLAGESAAVAVHAGWRGLAAGIIGRAIDEIAAQPSLRAWIGPSIGPCCYEVAEDVARSVCDGSGIRMPEPERPKPHLDLRLAAIRQLERGGVERIDCLDWCTRCASEWLASYRRDGPAAGRNLSLIWREPEDVAPVTTGRRRSNR